MALFVAEDKRLCTVCGAILAPGDKAAKQHLKSITHKRALLGTTNHQQERNRREEDCGVDDDELSELLGRVSLDESRRAPYVLNRSLYRTMFCSAADGCILPPPILRNPKRDWPSL